MSGSDTTGTNGDEEFGGDDNRVPGEEAARPKVEWRKGPDLSAGRTDPADDGSAPVGGTAAADEPEQLSMEDRLGDSDISLPWLEGDDNDDEPQGYDSGQLVSLLMLGLLALALIVGGIWWATRKSSDTELVADGSVIEAPDQPYKEKPGDPGGKTFEGTGDTSFAVSQGESRPARLGVEDAPPSPGFEAMPVTSPSAAASTKAPAGTQAGAGTAASAAAPGGVGVQVAAFSTRDSAEKGWARLVQDFSALSGMPHRIVEGQADIGKVYRLQAVASDAAAAGALCRKLKSAGLNCQVKN